MKRKILTILLAMVMTLITIPFSVSAEIEVVDGQLSDIYFEKNADMIISPTDDVAEIDPATFAAGLTDSYGSGLFGNGFGGWAKYHLPVKNGKLTFSETVYDTQSKKLISGFLGAKTYEIPFDKLSENESKVLDSYVFSTVAPYGKTVAPNKLNIKLDETSSTSLYLITNQRAASGFTAEVIYTDGSTEKNTASGRAHPQISEINSVSFENVVAKTNDDGTVEISENVTDKKIRIAGYITQGAYRVFTTSLGTVENESLVQDDTAEISAVTTGFTLWEIKLDPEKAPKSLTISVSDKYPIALYNVSQQQTKNEYLLETIKKAEAIEAGIYSVADIELMRLALSYIEILNERNYNYDSNKIEEALLKAEKQGDLAEISNVDFEKNADTLIMPDANKTATINPDTWFAGLLDSYSAGFFEQGFSGGELSMYNSVIKNGAISFSEKVYDTTNSKLITAFEGARTFVVPVSQVSDDELDSYILSTSVPYGKEKAPSSLTVKLDEIPSDGLYIISNRRGASSFKATVYYKDGTEETATIASVQSNVAASEVSIYNKVTSEIKDGKTYITRNPSQKAYAVGTVDIGYASFITTKMADGVRDTLAEDMGNRTRRLVLHELMLDNEKVPEKIVFSTDVIYPAAIYSIAQKKVTASEMKAYVDDVENMTVTDSELFEKLKLAKTYKDVLSDYGVIDESDYPNITSGFEKSLSKLVKIANIPFEKNADTLIVSDNPTAADKDKVATINPDTWFAGLLDNYKGGFYEQGFSGGLLSTFNSKIKNGVITFSEKVYDTEKSTFITDFEGARNFEIPVNTLADDELDSYMLSTSVPYGKEEAPSSLETALNDIPSTSLYLISNRRGESSFDATVYYKDGSSETYVIKSVQSNAAANKTTIYDQVTSEVKDGKTYITRNPSQKAYVVGTVHMGYPSYTTTLMTNNNGERDTVASYEANRDRCLVLHEIKIDSSKIPEKLVLKTNVIYPAAIYSIAQEQLSVSDMIAYLDEAETMSVLDPDFSEKVSKAKIYKNTLVGLNVIKEDTYPNITYKFDELLKAENDNYIDLSDYVDTDLMVNAGENVPSNIRIDTDAASSYNAYYDASKIPADGVIKMLAPENEKFASYNSGETGKSFKLSGAYNGAGSDAVKIPGKSEKTIKINSSVSGIRKSLSVILDSVYQGETRNPSGISEATEIGGYSKVSVVIGYEDGTSEEKDVIIRKSTGYYSKDVFAHSEPFGRLYAKDGKFVGDSRGSGHNTFYMCSSEIVCNTAKKITDITFRNNTSNEYYVLAISEIAYTNSELNSADTSVLDNIAADAEFTSFKQVNELLSASDIAVESHNRGIRTLSSAEYERITAIRNKASEFIENTADNVYMKEEGTYNKTITLVNTGSIPAVYTLILAAYNKDGVLIDIASSEIEYIRANDYEKVRSISVENKNADSYKLFVWDDEMTMRPLKISEYPFN